MYCYICKKRNPEASHHLFPKNPALRAAWLNAVGFQEDDILRYTRICSKHFAESCFVVINWVSGKKVLTKGSIPTLLLHNNKKSVKRSLQCNDAEDMIEKKPFLKVNAQKQHATLLCNDAEDITEKKPSLEENVQKQFVTLLWNDAEDITEKKPCLEVNAQKQHATLQCNGDEDITEKKPYLEVNAQKQHTSNNVLASSSNTAAINKTKSQRRRRPPGCLTHVDMVEGFSTPHRAKKHFLMAMSRVRKLKKKIIQLKRSNAKLLKRNRLLEDRLIHLKKNR